MKSIIYLALIVLTTLQVQSSHAQVQKDIVQFSGQVLYQEGEQLKPVVYSNIFVEGTQRGTYTDVNGFFSLVVKKSDRLQISYLGFQTEYYDVPDSLDNNRYNMLILLSKDTLFLSTIEVYPWPSREHFDIEFVAMDVKNELQTRAEDNLEKEKLEEYRDALPQDGSENYIQAQKELQADYYSEGQYRPMQILNPVAWKKFISDWKSGKYKRKKKK